MTQDRFQAQFFKNEKDYTLSYYYCETPPAPKASDVVAEFAKHGITVSEEAIAHNISAWEVDMKSSYVDVENGIRVFTPCGHNHLRFVVDAMTEENKNDTYMC